MKPELSRLEASSYCLAGSPFPLEVTKPAGRDPFISLAPHQGISLWAAQFLTCLLKHVGLERSGLLLISVLFCVSFLTSCQESLWFLCLLLSPCWVSKPLSQQLLAWAGSWPCRDQIARERRLPSSWGPLRVDIKLLELPAPCPPASALIKAGWMSPVASPETDIWTSKGRAPWSLDLGSLQSSHYFFF